MNSIRHHAPAGLLGSYIDKYCYKELLVPHVLTMPAFTDQFLEFYLQGRYTITERQSGHEFLSPASIFIGQQTTRNWDLRLQGAYRMFFIHFTPNGFHRIFNIPMKELTNRALDPQDLISKEIKTLHEQLSNTTSFIHMVQLVDEFMLKKLHARQPAMDKFDDIIQYIVQHHGLVDLNWLADQSNLGMRQFERKFDLQLGVSPKTFIRKTRLNHIVELKKQQPHLSWTQLTYRGGYFDQAHLIKDFRSLTGDSPGAFIKLFDY
jgi:AraC-like DNA-binding protein